MEKKEARKEGGINTASKVKYLVLATLTGIAIGMIFIVIWSIIANAKLIPDNTSSLVVTGITLLSGVVAGMVAARKIGKMGLVYGLLTGLTMSIVLCIIGLFVQNGEEERSLASKLPDMLILAAAGGLGGVIGVNRKKK